MELRHLHYFLVVAEHLHFGRAAEELRMSQPPLTVAVKKLEQELGVQLFDRTTRSVSLTPAGRMYLDRIKPLLSDLDKANRELTEAGLGPRGRLNVGFVSSASYATMPSALRRFRELRPNVELVLNPLTTDEQIEKLLEGSLDLGILRDPTRVPGIELREIHSEPLVVALPAGHRLGNQDQIDASELADEDFVLFPYKYMSGFYSLVHSLFDGHTPPSNCGAGDPPGDHSRAGCCRAGSLNPASVGFPLPDARGLIPSFVGRAEDAALCRHGR
ncbi:LysR substrate-binding domain-containing protein [Glutamicibacter halophytocola]